MNLKEDVMFYDVRVLKLRTKDDMTTKESYHVIVAKRKADFDFEDIAVVLPYAAKKNGEPAAVPAFKGKLAGSPDYNHDTAVVEQDGMGVKTEKREYDGLPMKYLDVPAKFFVKKTFMVISFKHSKLQAVVTKKDWEALKKSWYRA